MLIGCAKVDTHCGQISGNHLCPLRYARRERDRVTGETAKSKTRAFENGQQPSPDVAGRACDQHDRLPETGLCRLTDHLADGDHGQHSGDVYSSGELDKFLQSVGPSVVHRNLRQTVSTTASVESPTVCVLSQSAHSGGMKPRKLPGLLCDLGHPVAQLEQYPRRARCLCFTNSSL